MVFALKSSCFSLCFHGRCLSRREKRADSNPGSSLLSHGFAEEQSVISLWREHLRINQPPPLPGCPVTSRMADDWGEGEAENSHQLETWSLSLALVDKQQNKVASTFLPSYGSCTIGKGASLKTMMCKVSVSILAPKKEVAEN